MLSYVYRVMLIMVCMEDGVDIRYIKNTWLWKLTTVTHKLERAVEQALLTPQLIQKIAQEIIYS